MLTLLFCWIAGSLLRVASYWIIAPEAHDYSSKWIPPAALSNAIGLVLAYLFQDVQTSAAMFLFCISGFFSMFLFTFRFQKIDEQ